jgi:hypothetical protein
VKVHSRLRLLLQSLATVFGVSGLTYLFDRNAIAGLAVSTAVAEWSLGRLGISWSNPLEPAPHSSQILRAVAKGAAYGLVLGALVAVLLGGSIAFTMPSAGDAFTSIATSVLLAVRNELLEHGLLRRVLGLTHRPSVRVLVLGCATLAWSLGTHRTPSLAVGAVALAMGLVSGALWEGRSAFPAMGARFGFLFMTTFLVRAVLQGGPASLDLRRALIVLACAAGMAAFAVRRNPLQ